MLLSALLLRKIATARSMFSRAKLC